jgi:hypothetical protein
MARVLRKIRVSEISNVDVAANPHARVTFFKRDAEGVAKSLFGDVMQQLHDDGYRSTDRSRAAVEKLVRETIEGCGRDPFGMPGDPLSVRSLADKVVAMTKRGGVMLPITTEERDYTPEQAAWLAGNARVVSDAERALDRSIRSIVGDGTVVDKQGLVSGSVAQCRAYLADEGVSEDAIDAAIGGVVAKHLEVHMVNKSASSRCRHCGGKDPLAGDDEDEADTEKRLDLGVVRKAAMTSHDSIVADFRKRMPAASEAEVLKAATDSAEYMQLFRDEREAAFRAGGHL